MVRLTCKEMALLSKGRIFCRLTLCDAAKNLRSCLFSTHSVLSATGIYKNKIPATADVKDLKTGIKSDDIRRFKQVRPAKTEVSVAVTYDEMVQKFINIFMFNSEKEKAREIVEGAFKWIKMTQIEKYNKAEPFEKSSIVTDPKIIFMGAVENCKPVVVLKSIARGGIRYRIPVYCSEPRRLRLSMKFIIDSCVIRKRKFDMKEKLGSEFLQAFNNEGSAVEKKQALHRECEANRAFAHFRWG